MSKLLKTYQFKILDSLLSCKGVEEEQIFLPMKNRLVEGSRYQAYSYALALATLSGPVTFVYPDDSS